MTGIAIDKSSRWRQLDHLPIGLFGAVMGLTGLSVAWRLASTHFGVTTWIAEGLGAVAIVAFVAIALGYLVKLAIAPDVVRAEFNHPVAGSLFGTLLISLLLLPIIIAPASLLLARVLWVIAAVAMNGFAWLIVSRWLGSRQQTGHATPAWFVPVVGLLDVPLAVPSLNFHHVVYAGVHAWMMLDLAAGLFFSIPLFTLIFSRLLFDEPLPGALQPTLLILVAPFAVGFPAYLITTGHSASTDLFAQGLYLLTLFLLAVLLGRVRLLRDCCPFRFSWWSVSFPLAASSIAALRFAIAQPGSLTDTIAVLLLFLATLTVGGLLLRTLAGLLRGELRTLSG